MNDVEKENLTKSIIESKEKIDKFMEEFQKLPEFEVIDRIATLQRSQYILNGNYRELIETINRNLNPKSNPSLNHPKNHDIVEEGLIEVTRRLYNYEASVKSMVDHTRGLYSHLYSKNSLFADYETRKDQTFINNPLVSFVQDLRDYFLHRHIPRLNFGRKIEGISGKNNPTIYFTLEEMKKDEKWSATAKKYLKESDDKVDIINVISTYHQIVTEFYEWFFSRVEEIHLKEREKLWQLQQDHLLTVINVNIDLCIGLTQAFETRVPMPLHNEDIFEGLLERDEHSYLARFKPGSKERTDAAIELVETKLALPEDLKNKIRKIYRNPEFNGTDKQSHRPIRNQRRKNK